MSGIGLQINNIVNLIESTNIGTLLFFRLLSILTHHYYLLFTFFYVTKRFQMNAFKYLFSFLIRYYINGGGEFY